MRVVELAGTLAQQGRTPGCCELSGMGMWRVSSPEASQWLGGRCCPAVQVLSHLSQPGLMCSVSPSFLNPCCCSPACWRYFALWQSNRSTETPCLCIPLTTPQAGAEPCWGRSCPAPRHGTLLAALLLVVAAVGTVGPWADTSVTASQAHAALTALTVTPAVADFASQAPLSQALAAFPSQATSFHCPSPADCKTSRAQGKWCFPEAPLPGEGCRLCSTGSPRAWESCEHSLGYPCVTEPS